MEEFDERFAEIVQNERRREFAQKSAPIVALIAHLEDQQDMLGIRITKLEESASSLLTDVQAAARPAED